MHQPIAHVLNVSIEKSIPHPSVHPAMLLTSLSHDLHDHAQTTVAATLEHSNTPECMRNYSVSQTSMSKEKITSKNTSAASQSLFSSSFMIFRSYTSRTFCKGDSASK
jgi:hypothetical protein